MTQHAALTPERWSRFDLGQQLLQIGVEMHRATRFLSAERSAFRNAGYERVLRLVDLTVQVQSNAHLRRELLRWRELVAELYLRAEPDPAAHRLLLRALLQLHPESAKQVAILGL